MNADLVRCVGNAHRRGDRKDEISHWPASVMFHAPHGAKRMLVNIDGGNVQGVGSVDNPRAVFFLGIPCAAPPVGELRRKPPQRLARWNAIRKTDELSPACPQSDFMYGQSRER